ncbi:hypothetical protein BDZ94DRAFT_855912 [Collybia nuda]|uniref:DUF4470 domain-containing protein n=1 Tax=Collybia nuda TaxID=64659 RepID=A0A9P5Y0A7_9AGAR|nr:hypothetical protein BDZ94DRAFT_855912 [Collybia nuda]
MDTTGRVKIILHTNPLSVRPPIMANYVPVRYKSMLSRIRRPRVNALGRGEYYGGTLETFMSLGLGSGVDGGTISQLPCGNSRMAGRGSGGPCVDPGVLACSRVRYFLRSRSWNLPMLSIRPSVSSSRLEPSIITKSHHLSRHTHVQYCSGRCQRQHWARHRIDCENPLLDPNWQPAWVYEARDPHFGLTPAGLDCARASGIFPAVDHLQLAYNEGLGESHDFKLCFVASGDIRSLVKTVNGLPKDYSGKCDILLNGMDAVAINRNLIILYALLSAGPSIEESAELAIHLMYSAALSAASAAYLQGCVRIIYGDGAGDGDMSFQTCLKTRGGGRLISLQTATGIKRLMEMSRSTYNLRKGLKSMHDVTLDLARDDHRDKIFVALKPAHRLALLHFWRTGILGPFSLDIKSFNQPNRLLFSAQGGWLGQFGANPLHGWDVTGVQSSGPKYGVDPSDVFGCLFFHVKHELMEFARRMKEFRIDVHLTQFDPYVLAKGISAGVLPPFKDKCFDRIETADLGDRIGIRECLINWAPLLNRLNDHASVLMRSRSWHRDQPNAVAHLNPQAVETLMKRCNSIPRLESRLRHAFSQGMKSPAVLKLVESLDAFVDHEGAFQEYLRDQEAETTASVLGLCLRAWHRIHPKRYGIPLNAPQQKLPNLSKKEFYDMFTIGGVEHSLRFIEFECVPEN